MRSDPDGGTPSGHGLRRLTNFPLQDQIATGLISVDPAVVFASNDDAVMQTDGTPSVLQGRGSPVVNDLSTGSTLFDYAYTWMWTGRQTDVLNGTVFDGDMVIFHNRPFAFDTYPANPLSGQGGSVTLAAGETVVEAIFAYGSIPNDSGFYSTNETTVLLRWHKSQPDPVVRVGGWIADVTYERFNGTEFSRFYPGVGTASQQAKYYPAQRCYWYRVVKKGQPTSDHELANYRELVVQIATPVRAKTPIQSLNNAAGGGSSLQVNAALISPYVVNVVPKVFFTR